MVCRLAVVFEGDDDGLEVSGERSFDGRAWRHRPQPAAELHVEPEQGAPEGDGGDGDLELSPASPVVEEEREAGAAPEQHQAAQPKPTQVLLQDPLEDTPAQLLAKTMEYLDTVTFQPDAFAFSDETKRLLSEANVSAEQIREVRPVVYM